MPEDWRGYLKDQRVAIQCSGLAGIWGAVVNGEYKLNDEMTEYEKLHLMDKRFENSIKPDRRLPVAYHI